jgi:poly(A) polymerase
MMQIKDDALRRAGLFSWFVKSLPSEEKRAIGAIKEILFFGDLPEDDDEARQYLSDEKNRYLYGRSESQEENRPA